jgi:hypothetical protein
MGKIALRHLPAIDELLQRGLAHAPRLKPLFLGNETGAARIAALRTNGGVATIWSGE